MSLKTETVISMLNRLCNTLNKQDKITSIGQLLDLIRFEFSVYWWSDNDLTFIASLNLNILPAIIIMTLNFMYLNKKNKKTPIIL